MAQTPSEDLAHLLRRLERLLQSRDVWLGKNVTTAESVSRRLTRLAMYQRAKAADRRLESRQPLASADLTRADVSVLLDALAALRAAPPSVVNPRHVEELAVRMESLEREMEA